MPADLSRRDFSSLLQLGALLPFASAFAAASTKNNFRVRTITAGLQMQESGGFDQAEAAIVFLRNAREIFEVKGYEVQTLRLATQPMQEYLPDWRSSQSIQAIQALDRFAVENEVTCSIGPVFTNDFYHEEFAAWAVEVIGKTKNISFSVSVASAGLGVHYQSLRSAAEAMLAIANGTPGGEGNFRFAANAFTPAGTPFFPAAYFHQGRAFSIGLESPNLLRDAFRGAANLGDAKSRLKVEMEAALGPVAALGNKLATDAQWQYLGIDTSPAPGLDASIGQAIEMLTKKPFGSASTLSACAAITDVLKNLSMKTCGYSGLMLPIMEDPVLAQRAAEKRYTVSELLLYSSVCGTGLDVVPIPGSTPEAVLTAILTDVAALATKYQKPLSARLFPVPGKQVGETVSFDNPHLTDAVVMSLV
jgi:uncharacterized protein (UPF0210 family)